ncbi:hypothetical protein PMIN03_011709 [Paraphaeosphaeria minitans]
MVTSSETPFQRYGVVPNIRTTPCFHGNQTASRWCLPDALPWTRHAHVPIAQPRDSSHQDLTWRTPHIQSSNQERDLPYLIDTTTQREQAQTPFRLNPTTRSMLGTYLPTLPPHHSDLARGNASFTKRSFARGLPARRHSEGVPPYLPTGRLLRHRTPVASWFAGAVQDAALE